MGGHCRPHSSTRWYHGNQVCDNRAHILQQAPTEPRLVLGLLCVTFALSQDGSAVKIKYLPKTRRQGKREREGGAKRREGRRERSGKGEERLNRKESESKIPFTLTTPPSLPAARSWPSCRKQPLYATSSNREMVFFTSLVTLLYTCTCRSRDAG